MSKCQGCGITIQTENKNALGYTTNIENQICERCFRLKNYGEYNTVSLDNKDYEQIITSIPKNALIVYVADILSLNLSNLLNFPNILLVLTKYDILPKSTKEQKIITKLKETYPSFIDIICISSLKNYHIDNLYQALNKYSNGKDIYLIGNTNSGKSTLLNKLITNYSNELKPTITVSMYPSTTLDKVEVNLNNLKLIDTPGLIDEGNYANILPPKVLKKITPKKEIKPRSCQVSGKGSILIDTLARIDYETTTQNSFVIYTAPTITSSFISEKNNTLKDLIPHKYSLTNNQDIVLPGLGFIKFTKEITVTIYTPKNIKPYQRTNLI
ncbi:MAG: 50S ribosome-binding GTPase [Bacilli bacterium]|nr:50S ribosome-binding GTPase [Bacilli bacterium]